MLSGMQFGAVVGTYVTALILFSVLASVGSIVTYIIIVVANRAEPDPTGRRTSAILHVGSAFVTLWIQVAGVITIFVTLFGLIGTRDYAYIGPELHPLGDATVRGVSLGILLVLVGTPITRRNRRKALELAEHDEDPSSPARRVVRSYAAVVSFICMFVLVVAALVGLWAVLGFIAPGVYETGTRTSDLRALLDVATVLTVFGWVSSTHRRLVGGRGA